MYYHHRWPYKEYKVTHMCMCKCPGRARKEEGKSHSRAGPGSKSDGGAADFVWA